MNTKTYEVKVPAIDVRRGLIVEVLETGNGDVLLNGVVLEGARLVRWQMNLHHTPYYEFGSFASTGYYSTRQDDIECSLVLGGGSEMTLKVRRLILTEGKVPTLIDRALPKAA